MTLHVKTSRSLVAFFIAMTLNGSCYAAGFGTLEEEIERVVGIVKSSLGDATQLRIEEFRDLSAGTDFSSSVAPGLKATFVRAFEQMGITSSPQANHILTAEFLTNDLESLKRGDPLELVIQFGLKSRRGRTLTEILPIHLKTDAPTPEHFATITDTKEIARVLGLVGMITSDVEAGQQVSKRQRQTELGQRVLKPTGFVRDKLRLLSSINSPYEVEILAKPVESRDAAKTLQATIDNGRPFVDIPLADLYEVKIYNKSSRDVAVALSIDGLDVFHFAEEKHRDKITRKPAFTHYILHPQGYQDDQGAVFDGTLTIAGWFKKIEMPDNVMSFLVTSYGQGAISMTKSADRQNVGAIHLQFSHCRPLAEGAKARGGKETGFGPPRSVKLKAVRYEIDPAHDFLTIRYDRKPVE